MKFRILLCLTVIAAACSCRRSSCLFNDGQSGYTIVAAPGSTECVKYAAEELQHWLREVSGAEIPITEDLDGGCAGKRLIVGYNALTSENMDAEEPDGKNDSFTYASDGGDIYFWGDTDRGTLYSVYSFLERELGCRWYNDRVSVAPKCVSWSFTELRNSESPAIRMRNVFYYDVIYHPEFANKMRSNSCLFEPIPQKFGGSIDYCGGHTLPHFVPVSEYYGTHPEYFSEIDGKRIKEQAQICLSNPDVLKIVIGKVRETIKANPNHLVYSVSQGDYGNPCQCEKCRAIKEQYGNEESGVMVWFVNQVADAIKDEFPDKFIGTFAYWYSQHYPQNIKPRDNVVIRLCSFGVCQIHKLDGCDQNRGFLDDLQGWAAIAPHLYIWDYSTIFTNYSLPLPNIPVFQDKIRRYRDSGAIGVMTQGSYQCPINAFEDLKAYVMAKLLWNPDADVDAIVKDFTDGFFGPVAGPIMRDYLAYEASALAGEDKVAGILQNEDAPIYSDSEEYLKKGREYFAKARAAVTEAGGDDTETVLSRLEYGEIGLCVLETLLYPQQGRSDGSLDLIKRVVEREGIRFLREIGEHRSAEEYIKFLETKQ